MLWRQEGLFNALVKEPAEQLLEAFRDVYEVIAHRMRTVEQADKIVAIHAGEVAESGTPQAQTQANGLYQHLLLLQTGHS